jgi:hypothetical protein
MRDARTEHADYLFLAQSTQRTQRYLVLMVVDECLRVQHIRGLAQRTQRTRRYFGLMVVDECLRVRNSRCAHRARRLSFSRTGHTEDAEATQRHYMIMVVESHGRQLAIRVECRSMRDAQCLTRRYGGAEAPRIACHGDSTLRVPAPGME